MTRLLIETKRFDKEPIKSLLTFLRLSKQHK